ncbi:MAG: FxLYD domain-containing protein, partial [Bifidobacteriaceae bacterium]|nr:FxLYD domain-containing protein [Bifidobacteriaceae bacterium]
QTGPVSPSPALPQAQPAGGFGPYGQYVPPAQGSYGPYAAAGGYAPGPYPAQAYGQPAAYGPQPYGAAPVAAYGPAGPGGPQPPRGKKPVYKQWWLWSVVAVVVIALVGGGIFMFKGKGEPKADTHVTASATASHHAAALPSGTPTDTPTASPTPTDTATPAPAPIVSTTTEAPAPAPVAPTTAQAPAPNPTITHKSTSKHVTVTSHVKAPDSIGIQYLSGTFHNGRSQKIYGYYIDWDLLDQAGNTIGECIATGTNVAAHATQKISDGLCSADTDHTGQVGVRTRITTIDVY